jgi:SAM-dependent methyltransferase
MSGGMFEDEESRRRAGEEMSDRLFDNEADPAFRRRASWIARHLRSRFSAPFALTDIGCGRGFYFPLYHALGARIVGVERDDKPFRLAQARAGMFDAALLQASAYELPLADGSADAVVMSEILEHLDRPVAALEQAARILAPGGLLLVTVPNANYPFLWDPINWVLERTTGRPIRNGPLAGIWANHVRLYGKGDLVAQIEQAGFRVAETVFHTHRCMPFVHNIVYGLGKPLLEGGLMPQGWQRSAERGRPAGQERKRGLNPVALGIRAIQRFDRGNAAAEPEDRSTVNICVAAIKA